MPSTDDLLASLEQKGVELALEGEKLVADGRITDEIRAAIRQNKKQLVDALFTREADRLVQGMLRRVSDIIPEDHHIADWTSFDAIEREIDAARQRHDVQALRAAIKRYEDQAVQEIVRKV